MKIKKNNDPNCACSDCYDNNATLIIKMIETDVYLCNDCFEKIKNLKVGDENEKGG